MARLPVVPENWLDDDQQAGGGSGVSGSGEPKASGPKNPIGPVKGYPETGKEPGGQRMMTSSPPQRTSIILAEIFVPVMWSI